MTSYQKTLVGAFLAGGFLLFAVGLFWIGDRRQMFTRSITLYAEYRNVSGLENGSVVHVGGIGAGEVLEIQVPPGPEVKFRVRFRVAERFQPILRLDSVATIQNQGLMGSRFLRVDPGSAAARQVVDGDTILTREPVEIGDLLEQAGTTVQKVDVAFDEVRGGVNSAMQSFLRLSEETTQFIDRVGSDVDRFTSTGNRIAGDVAAVVEGVKEGRGTVGKLLADETIYNRLRDAVNEAGQTMNHINQATEDFQEIVADVRSKNLPESFSQTAENVRQITGQANDLLASLRPSGPDGQSLTTNLRETLQNANDALSDFAENAEALKRNWFFRGFFRDRGFFDLGSISVDEYRQGKFAPERPALREWLFEGELFTARPDGTEVLSEEGKKRLDAAMANLFPHSANNPLVVEGYASQGDSGEILLRSLDRATQVQAYLIRRFSLKPNYLGIVPLGTVRTPAPGGSAWGGVSLVLYLPKGTKIAPN
ncbi:MAG: MCE family protein [Acidobacteria bacterium]|nr:MCE family protein [Acidobacteriota bacterium]